MIVCPILIFYQLKSPFSNCEKHLQFVLVKGTRRYNMTSQQSSFFIYTFKKKKSPLHAWTSGCSFTSYPGRRGSIGIRIIQIMFLCAE